MGWVGGEGWGGRWRWVGNQRRAKGNIETQTVVLCHQYIADLDWHSSQSRPGLLFM